MDTVTAQEKTKEFQPPKQDFSEFLTEMCEQVARETERRSPAIRAWRLCYQMYRGEIGRPHPDLPWEGSSDIRYRLAACYVRQMKPAFSSLVLNAPKIVRYTPLTPEAVESARRLEAFAEHLYRGRLRGFADTVDACAAQLLIYGKTVVKITWDIRWELRTRSVPREELEAGLEQALLLKREAELGKALSSGKEPTPEFLAEVKLTAEERAAAVAKTLGLDMTDPEHAARVKSVLKQLDNDDPEIELVEDKIVVNHPVVRPVNLEDIIVPVSTGKIQDAEWIVHKLRMNSRQLRERSVANGGAYRNVEWFLEQREGTASAPDSEQRQMEHAKRAAENIVAGELSDDTHNVWELYCWVPRRWIQRFNGQTDTEPDFMVRAVITFSPDLLGTGDEIRPFRVMELPYHHGKWPFEDATYNFVEDRFYSGEGVVALLFPIEMEYNICRNAAINRTTLSMSPPIFYDEDSGFDPTKHKQFSQYHPINRASFVATGGQPVRVLQFPDLSTLPNYDAAHAKAAAAEIVGAPNLGQLAQYATAPTAEQVQQVVFPSQQVQAFELQRWARFWSRVFEHVHALCRQYLFLDADTTEIKFQEPDTGWSQVVTKQDFEHEFVIACGGDPTSANQVLQDQKRFAVMQMALSNKVLAPFIRIYDAWQQFVHHMLPYNEAAALVPPREEAAKMQELFLQMQAALAAREAAGKRTREPRIKQLNNAQGGILPR